jgi:hypothetical protein
LRIAVSFFNFRHNSSSFVYHNRIFSSSKKHFMKNLLLLFLFCSFIIQTNAQQAFEGSIDFQRSTQPAALIECLAAEKTVEKAVIEYFSKKGYKSSDSKGFLIFKGYKLKNGEEFTSDLYFKIERKSRKEKEATVVYLVTGKAGEDIKKRTASDNSSLSGAKDLLNDIQPAVTAYDLELQIQDQEETVKKADKKYNNLLDDQKDYEKRIKGLQEKLEENKNDQIKQQAEVKKQKEAFEALKLKRKL